MHTAYTTLAKYYDLIYSSKGYPKQVDFLKKLISLHYPKAKRILDVGCGSGMHLNLLGDSFEQLWGIDLNKEIIDVAKKKSPKISYQVAGMADFNLSVQFDIILCLYSVFNYNLTREEGIRTLKNFRNHIVKNGLVIFALYKPINVKKAMSIHAGKSDAIEIAKINQYSVDPETQIQSSDFVVFLKEKGKLDFFVETNHQYKIYQIEEFKIMLNDSGFKTLSVFDGYTDKEATDLSEYPLVIARAY